MANKQKIKTVHCRYPKCSQLHETTELPKDEAVQGGSKNSYYHPDCYHTLQTVNKIRDLFVLEVDSTLTGKQVGMLVSTINNIIFSKKVDVNFLEFALEYMIKNKPGVLKHPAGLHYIIQNRDIINAWNKEKEQKIKTEIKNHETIMVNDEFLLDDLPEQKYTYKPQGPRSFADILR